MVCSHENKRCTGQKYMACQIERDREGEGGREGGREITCDP